MLVCAQHLRQNVGVLAANVALVGARVNGEAMHAERNKALSENLQIGSIVPARVTQQGEFVQIDAK